MANLSQQAIAELHTLSAIFDKQWQRCQPLTNTYTIKLGKNVQFWITLNEKYPTEMPPSYEVWAPKLTTKQRGHIYKEFAEIYERYQGGPIIFHWIGKLKDIVGYNDGPAPSTLSTATNNKGIKNCMQSEPKMETLNIIHGKQITDRKSTFQAHVCHVKSVEDVEAMIDILLRNKKIRDAKHNVVAYRIENGPNKVLQDYRNDGENLAGSRLLTLLRALNVTNVAVVVTRWFGGIQLSGDRFHHYHNTAHQVLIQNGFISPKS